MIIDAEAPAISDGYASENSVLAVLWDLFDTQPDAIGGVTDSIAGVGPRTLWDVLTAILACNPCDRIDRMWSSVLATLGFPNTLNPAVFEIAKPFVINRVAPRATAPPDGATVDDAPPRFEWFRNGDPNPDHQNNRFVLALSRDNFQGHLKVLVPPPGADQYTPTQGEWNDIRQGGSPTSVYKWFVAGWASPEGDGNPEIPEGLPWISNALTFSAQQGPPPVPTGACGPSSVGTSAGDTRTFEMGKTPATFNFEYRAGPAPTASSSSTTARRSSIPGARPREASRSSRSASRGARPP